MFKKRLLLILFLVTVLIYAMAVFWSIQDYEEWKKATLERYPPEMKPFVDFYSYVPSGHGTLMIVLGAIIGLVWAIISLILQRIERTSKVEE